MKCVLHDFFIASTTHIFQYNHPDLVKCFSLQTETFTHLNTDTIQSIKRGVEFGRLLQLPDEVCFSSQHMGDVLTSAGIARPFHQIRSVYWFVY